VTPAGITLAAAADDDNDDDVDANADGMV